MGLLVQLLIFACCLLAWEQSHAVDIFSFTKLSLGGFFYKPLVCLKEAGREKQKMRVATGQEFRWCQP